jgi:hypothetical protein
MDNNYGSIFQSLIISKKPAKIVECGILDGYSTLHIATALRFLETMGHNSVFHAFDLFDDYEFKHGNMYGVRNMLIRHGVYNKVTIRAGDCFEVYKEYLDNTIDFMHIDISNDGDKLLKVLKLWGSKMKVDGIIAFEGGSKQRDNIEWMKTFDKRPIQSAFAEIPLEWRFTILEPFPSMMLLLKTDTGIFHNRVSEDEEWKYEVKYGNESS